MDLGIVLTALSQGAFDENLSDLKEGVLARREALGRKRFNALKVGDKVTFASGVGKGLAGEQATVVEKRRTRVVIEVDGTSDRYVTNPSILELA